MLNYSIARQFPRPSVVSAVPSRARIRHSCARALHFRVQPLPLGLCCSGIVCRVIYGRLSVTNHSKNCNTSFVSHLTNYKTSRFICKFYFLKISDSQPFIVCACVSSHRVIDSSAVAQLRTEILHERSATLAYLDVENCTAFDLLPSTYVVGMRVERSQERVEDGIRNWVGCGGV